jgi:predicted CXXCH cytochrome family protein
VISDQNCTICHASQGARFEKTSLHSAEFLCSDCHTEESPEAGAGHRRVPGCAECHTNGTHAPPGIDAFLCRRCHDPHGTDNTHLVLDEITTSQGQILPIEFNNLTGKADGSFASATRPGSGICEVCHKDTAFYRADGGGLAHFEFSCLPCHRHSVGFSPP